MLGNWTGEAKTHLEWAWTDLAGKPVGPVATSAPPKPAAPAAAKPAPPKSAAKAPAAKAPAKTPAKAPAPKPAAPDDSGLPPAANQK